MKNGNRSLPQDTESFSYGLCFPFVPEGLTYPPQPPNKTLEFERGHRVEWGDYFVLLLKLPGREVPNIPPSRHFTISS